MSSQAISKELAGARQTAASLRFDIESDEHLILSPNDADVRTNLDQEFSRMSQRKTSELNLHMTDLSAQNASMKEQISIVQLERAQNDQSVSDGLIAALEEARAQAAAYRKEVRSLTRKLGEEQEGREAAEEDAAKLREKNKRLRSTLDDQLHQTEMLNSVVKGSSQQGDLKRQILQAIEQTESAKVERDAALARVASLEKAVAAAGSVDLHHLSLHEVSMREEVRALNATRTSVMKSQLTELEMDRDRLEAEVATYRLKLEKSVMTIDSISRSHGAVTARHEEVERERDAAHVQVKALKAQVSGARFDAAHHRGRITDPSNSDSASRSSSRGTAHDNDADLEEAMEQRDHAIKQCRTLQRQYATLQAEANSGGGFQLAQALEQIGVLELEIIKAGEQRRHANRDLQLALERGSQVEMAAAKSIKQLETDLKEAIAQTSIRGDFTSMEAMRLIRSKQFQAKLHMDANEKLRNFAEREAEVSQNPAAARVLTTSDVVNVSTFESLPPNWEAMISPEGLEYYVDHTRQVTTWHHPGYPNSDQLLTATSPTPLTRTAVNNAYDSSRSSVIDNNGSPVPSNAASDSNRDGYISVSSRASPGDRSIHPEHRGLADKLGTLRQKSVSRSVGGASRHSSASNVSANRRMVAA